jgi:hypothetical protein
MVKLICKNCEEEFKHKNNLKKYCEKCIKEKIKANWKAQNAKASPKYSVSQYEENFLETTKSNRQSLSPVGFNEISKISHHAYVTYFRKSWVDILSMFSKEDLLYEYIKQEYNTKNYKSVTDMFKSHKYLTINLYNTLDKEKLIISTDIILLRYSDIDYVSNFTDIKNIVKGVPLFSEFRQYSKISLESYYSHYKIPKGKQYDLLIKLLVSEDEYLKYREVRKENKSNIGKITGKLNEVYTKEDYKNNFIKIVEEYILEYGEIPSRRMFNMLSNIKDRSYRKKLNKSWSAICKFYGYEIDLKPTKFENHVLKTVAKLLNTTYIPQKTWDWLKNERGYNLFCDGFYQTHNLVVEADGMQHFEPYSKYGGKIAFENLKKNDKIKNQLLYENGIKLLRISYNEPWIKDDYISSKLEQVL